MINPPKNFFRLKPGGRVRLRNGFTIECTSFELNDSREVKTIKCKYFADSKSGTEGFSKYKVKGNIHWVSKKYNEKNRDSRNFFCKFRINQRGINKNFSKKNIR